MAKLSKRIHAFQDKVEKGKYYSVQDAVNLLKEVSSVKFDEVEDTDNVKQFLISTDFEGEDDEPVPTTL